MLDFLKTVYNVYNNILSVLDLTNQLAKIIKLHLAPYWGGFFPIILVLGPNKRIILTKISFNIVGQVFRNVRRIISDLFAQLVLWLLINVYEMCFGLFRCVIRFHNCLLNITVLSTFPQTHFTHVSVLLVFDLYFRN